MNILAIDYGTKTFGLAISLVGISMPYDNIQHKNNEETINKIIKIILEENISKVLLGLPLNTKNENTERSLLILDFYSEFKNKIPTIDIILIDEKFTTKDSIYSLKKIGVKNKNIKNIKDSVSAMNILKRYLGE